MRGRYYLKHTINNSLDNINNNRVKNKKYKEIVI